MHRHSVRCSLAVAALALLAGCTGQASAAPPAPAATSDDPPVAPPLADGGYFGFLTDVDPDGRTITFDPATWVVADEPNGYRIDNDAVEAEILPVAADAAIDVLLQAGDPTTAASVDVDELETWFLDPASGTDVAFDVTVADGEATTIAFRYRP